jgi:hypothetical protein
MSKDMVSKVLLSDVQISQVTQQNTTKWQVVNPQFIEDLSHVVCKAQLKAVIEWLDKPCKEHEVDEFDQEHLMEYIDFELVMIPIGSKLAKDKHREYPAFGWFYKHRKDCPKCWADLKGEL